MQNEKNTRVAKCKCGSYKMIASVEHLSKDSLKEFAQYTKNGYQVFDTTKDDAIEGYCKQCTCNKKKPKPAEQKTLF